MNWTLGLQYILLPSPELCLVFLRQDWKSLIC
jgi:hypothetical protein